MFVIYVKFRQNIGTYTYMCIRIYRIYQIHVSFGCENGGIPLFCPDIEMESFKRE